MPKNLPSTKAVVGRRRKAAWKFYWLDGRYTRIMAIKFSTAAIRFYRRHVAPDFDIVKTGSVAGVRVEKCRMCGLKVFEDLQTKSKYAGICNSCATSEDL